jgi:hypothetical protein
MMCNNLFQRLRALSPAIKSALAGLRAESRGLDIIQTQVDDDDNDDDDDDDR